MDLFRRKERMDSEESEALAGLRPLYDPVFAHLLEGAVRGVVPVYYAALPPSLIAPFDRDYSPSKHPLGEETIQQVMTAWRQGQVERAWVYEKGEHFVLSDDYIVLEAVRRGNPDYMPCWILGKPGHPDAKDVQGPISASDVSRLLGFANAQPAPAVLRGEGSSDLTQPTTREASRLPSRTPFEGAARVRPTPRRIIEQGRTLATGLAVVLAVVLGVGLVLRVQEDLMPGYALVWLNDHTREYTSPPCLIERPDNGFRRQVQYSEAVRLRYAPEPWCRDGSGFDGGDKSLLRSFLESRGVMQPPTSRWDGAGNWRY